MAKAPRALPLTPSTRHDFQTSFAEYIRAGYSLMMIQTSEEARVEQEIVHTEITAGQVNNVVAWDVFDGFTSLSGKALSKEVADPKNFKEPMAALQAITTDKFPNHTIFIFRDLDDFFVHVPIRRALRTLVESKRLVNNNNQRPLIITTPRLEIHPKLRSSVTLVDFHLPDRAKLLQVFEYVKESVAEISAQIESKTPGRSTCSPELQDLIINNLLGLTSNEAENLLSKCITRHVGFCTDMLGTIKDEKANIIKKSEVLTYVDEGNTLNRDQIGGFENYIEFIDRRALAYTRGAEACQLDNPKGVVICGTPGTGKSVVAMATGKSLGLPVYTLDIGALFGSLVGETETRTRDAIRQVEAQQGCVLVLDECDKGFSNVLEGRSDGGVTQRIFGQILSWLASKRSRTFVIATMNRTKGIPPEFLRAGRFDTIFYTDLPHASEREAILKIHLKKRGVDPDRLPISADEWADLIENRTKDFVGAELEQVVVEARYLAFEDHVARVKAGEAQDLDPRAADPTAQHFERAACNINPMARTDPDGLAEIREYCKSKATPVSRAPKAKDRTPPKRGLKTDAAVGNN